jgi:hypothetical protein
VKGNKGKIMEKMKLKKTKEERRKRDYGKEGDVKNTQEKNKMRREFKVRRNNEGKSCRRRS